MYVEEKNRSWCSFSNTNDQRAVTIECASDTSEPYAMNSAVYATLIKLCTDICKRNGKSKLLWFADKNGSLNYYSYRAKTSAKRRKTGTNCKGSSCFTGKIKYKNCGCNFRRATQLSATAKSGKVNYWRCSEHSNGCQTVGLREDVLIPLLADALGMSEFDGALFRKTVDYISVLTDKDLEIHKKDGTVTAVVYAPPSRKHHPRTEEQKAHMRSLMKAKWTPERKAEMSERMKQIRKERGENWRKEK